MENQPLDPKSTHSNVFSKNCNKIQSRKDETTKLHLAHIGATHN